METHRYIWRLSVLDNDRAKIYCTPAPLQQDINEGLEVEIFFGCLMISLSLSQSYLRRLKTYLTFEQFLTRTRTWGLMMYAVRTWTKYLKHNLLGCSGKVSFHRWHQTAALVAQEPFLNGSSGNYVEEMYLSWKEDPRSVHRVGWLSFYCFACFHLAHDLELCRPRKSR